MAIEIAFSIGMTAGGGIIASWGGFQNKVKTMAFSGIVMGVYTAVLGVVPLFWFGFIKPLWLYSCLQCQSLAHLILFYYRKKWKK